MIRREILERFDFPDEKIHTIYNGVDLERFHPRNRRQIGLKLRQAEGVSPKKTLVLFLGSGFERKG